MTLKKNPEDLLKVGSPSLYKQEYCEALIECMANGGNMTCFAAQISVNRATVYNWTKSHPEFLDAFLIGKSKLEEYMIILGHKIMKGTYKDAKPQIWIFMMKNMCGWRDKHDVKTQHEIKIRPYIIKRFDGSTVEMGVKQDIIEAEITE